MKNQQHPVPPRWARKSLEWWAGTADTEDLLGDLEEDFLYNLAEKGKLKAQLIYLRQVASLAFSYSLKKRKKNSAYSHYYSGNSLTMIRNYFKIAVRNFSKQKLFTSINIVGLALGMSVCLLALSISVSILQSDSFHDKKDRIYQVNTHMIDKDDNVVYGSTFPAVGNYMEEKYPFIETALHIHTGFLATVNHNNNLLDFHGYFVDPEFFDVFSFELTQGDPSSALATPNTIVLTESVAAKLFREADPMGQLLETETGTYTVTGIMPDPKQTHLYFEVLTSELTYIQQRGQTNRVTEWQEYRGHYLYLLLQPGTSPEALELALGQTSQKAGEYNAERSIALESVGLGEAVPRWNISNAIGIGWDYPSMLFFLFIGLIILLPAIFNYTNLSISRALKRAKEIGIRKVVGAEKGQIQMQFIVETIVITLLALAGSILIFIPLQNEFLTIVAAAEVLDTSLRPLLLIIFILFGLLIGVVAGLFPAIYFSRLSPIHSLKGGYQGGGLRSVSISGIRKGLFVFQFGLSLFFVIGVATMAKQYRHVFSRSHGFSSEQVLTIPFYGQNKEVAIEALAAHPDVSSVTAASHLPGIAIYNQAEVTPNGRDTIIVAEVFVGSNFIENMEMELVWGSSLALENSTINEESVVVNEQFLRSVSVFPRSADTLTFVHADGTHARIAGVLKDLHYEPLSTEIRPMVFRHSLQNSNFVMLGIHSNDVPKTIGELEAIWAGIDQKIPFEATFLDSEIERAYLFLTVQIKIFSFLGALAITISCLGLLGMVSYATENRTKEIAIRKIMGASVSDIYLILTRDFVKLICYSALLAIPISYFFYDRLFLYMLIRYGTGVGLGEVVLSVVFLFLIGFLFIFWQTSKVAQTNPATNLRYE